MGSDVSGAWGGRAGSWTGSGSGTCRAGVGDLVTEFATEWDDVRFASRMWERETVDGARVDMRVHVLRGDRLASLANLRDFLAEYHERDSSTPALIESRIGTAPGMIGATEAFWLVAPGIGVNVIVAPEAVDLPGLAAVAGSIVPVEA
ncbi:hypothetical protein [Micromonospora sagamiensis]|uniref:Uncharacterized protein n=1 Tax=Micromonospora sagamiensis TaxID=47875 RepID=A0A562WDL7_9ACTN|nr:hypothetical protein [Micromonospora sagamiensis]TWJ28215.1 hypothetical protein JD81_01718 [Micromonospora sagamiensis]BCL12894.1 hypothetical protein GCM10017556_06330 [Micromonospora sagamiensis]